MSELHLRLAKPTDATVFFDIHRRSLPHDLLPRLGKKFNLNIFWPAVFSSNHFQAFTVIYQDKIAGFVVYEHQTGLLARTLRKEILRHPFFFVLELLKHRDALGTLLDTFLSKTDVVPTDKLHSDAELFVIAVDPNHQGQGVGRELTSGALKELRKKGWPDTCLVRTALADAAAFYTKLGFEVIGEDIRGKRRLTIFRKMLEKI